MKGPRLLCAYSLATSKAKSITTSVNTMVWMYIYISIFQSSFPIQPLSHRIFSLLTRHGLIFRVLINHYAWLIASQENVVSSSQAYKRGVNVNGASAGPQRGVNRAWIGVQNKQLMPLPRRIETWTNNPCSYLLDSSFYETFSFRSLSVSPLWPDDTISARTPLASLKI